MQTFFSDRDYQRYIALLAQQAWRHSLEIWTYCLMPNHVHLIAAPAAEDGLCRPIGEAHRRYAREINERNGWKGHLWQARFLSCPMEERHLLAAVRYVLLNPVRAGLSESVTEWPYSSARAQLLGTPDPLVGSSPISGLIPDLEDHGRNGTAIGEAEALRRHSRTGRPLGSRRFIKELERKTGRRLRPLRVGRKRKHNRNTR